MPAFMPRATPARADDKALLHVLEAAIETRAAQAPISEQLDALAAERARPWWRRLAG